MRGMSGWNGTNRMSNVNMALVIAMGIMLIAYFILLMYINFKVDSSYSKNLNMAPSILLLISGIALLLCHRKPVGIIIPIAAVPYSLYTIIGDIQTVAEGDSTIVFMMAFMDMLLIASAIHCYFGDRHSATRMFLIIIVNMILESSVMIMAFILIFVSLEALPLLILTTLDEVFLALFAIFLSRPGVREDFMKKRMHRSLLAVEAVMAVTDEAEIFRKDAEVFVGDDPSKWMEESEDSPIASRCRIPFRDGKKNFYFECKRWKGEDGIWVSMDQELKTEPFGRAFLMRGCRIDSTDEGDYLRIYGDTGFFIKMKVTDDPEPKRGLRDRLYSNNDEVEGGVVENIVETVTENI